MKIRRCAFRRGHSEAASIKDRGERNCRRCMKALLTEFGVKAV